METKELTLIRQAALTRLEERGHIPWSATTVTEAAALNWLVKNGYAKRVDWIYYPGSDDAHIP